MSAERLIALAAGWEAWAARASEVAAAMDDDRSARHLQAQAERAIEDATALRNLTTDMEAAGG